jgi:ATP-dependent protease Clp ATPase subunit
MDAMAASHLLTPQELVTRLDTLVVGQAPAK